MRLFRSGHHAPPYRALLLGMVVALWCGTVLANGPPTPAAASGAASSLAVPSQNADGSVIGSNVVGALSSPTPAGTNTIGKIGIDQSVPGTSNAVQLADSTYITGTCSANCNGTALLGPIDTTGAATLDVQLTAIGGGATINWQVSNDPVCSTASNWLNGIQGNTALNDRNTNNYTNFNFAGLVSQVPVTGHCMRLVFNAYTSGTYTGQAVLRSFVSSLSIQTPVSIIPTPGNLTQVTNGATGTTGAIAAALPAVSGHTNYLCGFAVTSAGTTAPAAVTVTVTGTISGTLSYVYYPATTGAQIRDTFEPCVPSSTTNTAITVSIPALGAGSIVAANVRGYE